MFIEKINLTDDPDVTLTAYVCEPSEEMKNMYKRPAMLVLPGGAYRFCSDREAEPIVLEYVAKGYNAFVLRYSLNEKAEFPRPLDDAVKALKTIRANADKWYIEPEKVAVIGFSAGGHLAAALSTMGEEKPNACLLGYPCILKNMEKILPCPIPGLETEVSAETPPTFIFAASDDKCVPIENTLKYALELEKNKIPFEIHIFNEGGHGFSTGTKVVIADSDILSKYEPVKYWVQRSVDWLDSIFNN
ncbi:MAG: alpha/beta hydrolase [Clostridia bacterium]|nr:alpha/beta hydrolase [Clostridia bacterium]